jgi:Ca2+-binding EF-hand superfamily protein
MAAKGAKGKGKGGAVGSFTSDFSQMGTGRSNVVMQGHVSILDEEKRLIKKVFEIVDKDNSGSIDTKELEEMFKLFGVETHVQAAIQRIMSNVDKDQDGTISPDEFEKLLSQKFQKGDPREEIDKVFDLMDTKKDTKLDVEEMHAVSALLGEQVDKKEIRDMIKTFKAMYEESDKTKTKEKAAAKAKAAPKPDETKSNDTSNDTNLHLDKDEWFYIMTSELP